MVYGHIVLARRWGNILSATNCFITGSYWSHAFTTVCTPYGRLLTIEAEAQGVTSCPFDINYEQDFSRDYIMYEVNIPQEAIDFGIDAALNKLESGYGYIQMPWFIWRAICNLFGKDIKSQNNWFSSDGTLCSQLAVEYLQAAGLGNLFADFGSGSVSPQDIYLIVKANPQIFTEVESRITYPNDPRL